MPAFQILLTLDDNGSWTGTPAVSNGTTVVHADVARLLVVALEAYTRTPGARVLTVSEVVALEAERALPDGWSAWGGTNVFNTDGVVTHSRLYRRGEGLEETVCEAPCTAQGHPTAETRGLLLAFAAGPPTPPPEA